MDILIKEQQRITLAEKGFCTLMLLYFRAQCATDSIQLNNSLSNKQWQYTEHHTTSLLWLKVIPVCDWTAVMQNKKAFTSYSWKGREQIGRGNLDCTSLVEWFYFLCSLRTASVQLWYSPGKGLVGRAVTACPREALSEKAAISNFSKQNHLKQKANRIICSGFFFPMVQHTQDTVVFSYGC